MSAVAQYLNSPYLVARFQKVCGAEWDKSTLKRDQGAAHARQSPLKRRHNEDRDCRSETGDSLKELQDIQNSTSTGYIVKYKTLDYIFHFGACLGNEVFYITFFPFWIWNVDSFVGRRVCLFWALFMYLGQATKDIIKWPRPKSPPVIRMEDKYALEYGMPSTHAMVGAGLPFGLLILTMQRYIVSQWYQNKRNYMFV